MPKRDQSARRYRVLISHDGLDAGGTFRVEPDGYGWAESRVAAGYLEEIAPDEEVAQDAGQVGQGGDPA